MRHSKSCSNHLRSSDPDVVVSQRLRDPGLSVLGERTARRYGPLLRTRLGTAGFDVEGAIIGASRLRRAQDTARIVFGRMPVALPHFAENGEIPENTPAGSEYAPPTWSLFLRHLSTLVHEGDSVAVVGHGSYLLSLWPRLTGSKRGARLNNLDGILLDADVSASGIRVHSFKEIPCSLRAEGADKCSIRDVGKIAVLRRGNMTRKQHGGNGSTGMPLAYFQDGAQMRGYSGEATGMGLAASTPTWIRAPLAQTGGRRSRSRTGRRTRRAQGGGVGLRAKRTRRTRRGQHGGFSPSVMGAFAANGARLMPVAAYMGYKMYSNQKTGTRTRRRRS